MLAVSVLVFAAAVAIYLRHPAASVFHPASFYLAFHGLVFVVRPIFAWYYSYGNMYREIGFEPTAAHKLQVLVCTNLGLVAFMAVSLRLMRMPLTFPDRAAADDARPALLRLFWIVAIPLGALAAWSMHWRWDALAGNVRFSALDPLTGEQRLIGVNGYFYGAAALAAPVGAALAYLGRFRWWTLVPLGAFAVLQLGTGGRGDFIAMAVMTVLLFMHDRRRKWPTALVIGIALALVPLFHVIQSDRGKFLRQTFRPDVEDRRLPPRSEPNAPLETMDIANLEFFEYLVWAIPERTGTYDYFVNNLEIVTGPIPRAIWPDKPTGAPIKRFKLYEGTRPIAITHSVPGRGWFNAGYIGVLLWCALFAAIYTGAFRAFARSRQGPLEVLAYTAFLATATIAFRDGLLQSLLRQLLFYAAPVLALSVLVRFRSSRAPPADTPVQAG